MTMVRANLLSTAQAGAIAALLACSSPASAVEPGDAAPVAIVPTQVIYPGQEITRAVLREAVVSNPNIREDYISSLGEVEGAVARRTLLPGRVIPPSAVREAYVVERGGQVRLIYAHQGLVISAAGSPLESAATGDFIRVRNTDTGVTVSGTVLADGTVRVVAQ
jgi:flagellar basal body P-ring formation protein FlgA